VSRSANPTAAATIAAARTTEAMIHRRRRCRGGAALVGDSDCVLSMELLYEPPT
jgi:hypothetical protein